jgi:hypothetical protein
MEINKVDGRGTYKYETKKIVGKNRKKKSYQDFPVYSPSDFIEDNFDGLSFKGTMKELWKYIKKGANFLKSKASNLVRGLVK